MKVSVKAFGSFKNMGFGRASLSLEDGSTLKDLLEALVRDESRHLVYGHDGKLREDLNILCNGKNVESLDGLDHKLKNGDEIAIFSAVVGG